MTDPVLVARNATADLILLPQMANRHGLITGATGTGKTVTLQTLAEHFSRIGVPCFMSDVKGDLSGISQPGGSNAKVAERVEMLKLERFAYQGYPVTLWDPFGKSGHPMRATVSDMGPLLLSRMLDLNETQSGVLNLAFKVADDNGLLLLDLKDLRTLLAFVGENAKQFTTEYGNVSAASIGAIQRGLLSLESQGGEQIFGEPMLNIDDLIQTDRGLGVINILSADQLMQSPKMYATLLLWLLAELFENLPEAGDLDKPKLVFFFDEAHLLFSDAPAALVEKIEQVVRLIRSKGVGVFFVTQNPADVPDKVLSQLGNRVQHALRAFSARDQKAVKAAAETMRDNAALDEASVITELGVGEALVSFLDDKGRPHIVERATIIAPDSRLGPLTPAERKAAIENSVIYGHYEAMVDRESAFEVLQGKPAATPAAGMGSNGGGAAPAPAEESGGGLLGGLSELLFGSTGPRGGRHPGLAEQAARSAVRTVGSSIGREIVRGVLGSILGGGRRR